MYEKDILCAFAAFIILTKVYHNQSFWWVLSVKKDSGKDLMKDLLLDDANQLQLEYW